jgi:uncharacterized protein
MDLIKSKTRSKTGLADRDEYEKCIGDIIQNEAVRSMKNIIQHSDVSCLEHCLFVSYSGYLICERFGLDYRSAARGGLLHDFFLYDWHIKETHKGLHGFNHPHTALENAEKHFCLNDIEKDIIKKHMWPLTVRIPRYKESFIVSLADKYYSFLEIIQFRLDIRFVRSEKIRDIIGVYTGI